MPWTAALAGDLSLFTETIWSAAAALAERARRHREPTERTVEIATGADAIALAAPAWHTIERTGGAATPFQSVDFAACAAKVHVCRGETPRIVVVSEGGRPMAVLPTVLRVWNGLRTIQFLGDPLIQYGDIVADPEAEPAHLQAAWHGAADPAAGQFVYLRKVRADARIAPLLSSVATVVAEHEAPFIAVQGPAAINARDARELRRLRRRLAEHGEAKFEVLDGAVARFAVAEALACKRGWLDARGLGSSVVGDPDWEQALVTLADAPHLRVARLSVGGRTAAVEIGLIHGGRWCAYLGALAPEFAKAGPGQIQMADTIAHCRASGLATYDLLAPADEYKRRMTRQAIPVRDHAVALGAGGRFGLLLARLVPLAKDWAGRLPRGLRRSLLGARPG